VGALVWVFALLCGAQLSAADCTSGTAIDVIRFPDARDELSCMRDSMMTVASLGIQPGHDEYWRFVCVRPQQREAASLDERANGQSQSHE
jgi:hypothetical protein